MTNKDKLKYMQPITRVHNIFRIRTIVNAVTSLNNKGKSPGDDEIAHVLVDTGLSKFRREKMKDRIMRRARDHLLTASYMGLLTRKSRPFGYSSTISGHILQDYGTKSECPNDSMEEAIFIDKLMRMKLTNVYDMQSRNQYSKLRSRPCLFILHVLTNTEWLHQHQIAITTGGNRSDPHLIDKNTSKLVSEVCKFNKPTQSSLVQFYKNFSIRPSNMNNITRNIRPLLDWCEAVGLIESKEIENTPGRWYKITERGCKILKEYAQKKPVWYTDLGGTPSAKAAILLFYIYVNRLGLSLDKDILKEKLNVGLSKISIKNLISTLEKDLELKFEDDFSKLKNDIDFTFDYDIPPENKSEVLNILNTIAKLTRLKLNINTLEMLPINNLQFSLENEHKNIRAMITEQFGKRTDLSGDPILARVAELVPTAGILGQYRSDFEKEVSLLLRLIGLNAIKYQGQLADRCTKKYLTTFFENNPDILITNGIESLVECKSIGEWKSLTGVKSIPKEIIIYQQALLEVNSDSVMLTYEGDINSSSQKMLVDILKDFNDIIFVTKNYLINCIHKPALKEKMMQIIKEPKKFDAEQRILHH